MSFRSQNQAFIIDHMRENNFYNTTHLKGEELITEQGNAKTLQNKVLKLFQSEPKKSFIWSDIWNMLGKDVTNESSVKRSITNLMKDGLLYKTKCTKKSIYGKTSYMYILAFK